MVPTVVPAVGSLPRSPTCVAAPVEGALRRQPSGPRHGEPHHWATGHPRGAPRASSAHAGPRNVPPRRQLPCPFTEPPPDPRGRRSSTGRRGSRDRKVGAAPPLTLEHPVVDLDMDGEGREEGSGDARGIGFEPPPA